MSPDEILRQLDLGEDQDVEFKAAEAGLPRSLWETLSAFANMEGGTLVLGVSEVDQGLEVTGLRRPESLLKIFWDTHNNSQKLSGPICSPSDVRIAVVNGRKVIVISVPRATRMQRPVFLYGNPLTGTYKRNFEGDYRCTESEVRQMLRDASDDPQDAQILEGFDLDDLDRETLSAYRNRFGSRDPDHPFLALSEWDFLERLGALRRDRKSGAEGLTLAGLLMFGRERSLLDGVPHYHVDYQEAMSDDPEVRWTYRLTVDGKWEPNLFNFYYRAYPRLVEGLDLPFKLDRSAVRLEETHVHEALREALVNTLIHADHQSARPITVIKRRDAFIFTNPGRLRIPREMLYQGGVSDPRNPNLQKMFQLLGLGEKAGSGFQKILRAWREQHWLIPFVAEHPVLEMTRIFLPVSSMIPEAIEQEIRAIVGDQYASLDESDRLILMLAHRFGEVGNADIQPYCPDHPRDIGVRLRRFVAKGWLSKTGHTRGTRYRLPASASLDLFAGGGDVVSSSGHFAISSGHSGVATGHSEAHQDVAIEGEQDGLRQLAGPVRDKGRAPKELVEQTIASLCRARWLTLRELAELLGRDSEALRKHYITRLLRQGRLLPRYPHHPNHPEQAYQASESAGV